MGTMTIRRDAYASTFGEASPDLDRFEFAQRSSPIYREKIEFKKIEKMHIWQHIVTSRFELKSHEMPRNQT